MGRGSGTVGRIAASLKHPGFTLALTLILFPLLSLRTAERSLLDPRPTLAATRGRPRSAGSFPAPSEGEGVRGWYVDVEEGTWEWRGIFSRSGVQVADVGNAVLDVSGL